MPLMYDKVKHVLINGVILLKIKMTSKMGQRSHSLNIYIYFPLSRRERCLKLCEINLGKEADPNTEKVK